MKQVVKHKQVVALYHASPLFKTYVSVNKSGSGIEILRKISIDGNIKWIWISLNILSDIAHETAHNHVTKRNWNGGMGKSAIEYKMNQSDTTVYEFDSLEELLNSDLKNEIAKE